MAKGAGGPHLLAAALGCRSISRLGGRHIPGTHLLVVPTFVIDLRRHFRHSVEMAARLSCGIVIRNQYGTAPVDCDPRPAGGAQQGSIDSDDPHQDFGARVLLRGPFFAFAGSLPAPSTWRNSRGIKPAGQASSMSLGPGSPGSFAVASAGSCAISSGRRSPRIARRLRSAGRRRPARSSVSYPPHPLISFSKEVKGSMALDLPLGP